VHRDVKPENIMLLRDDTVKIMDFGIALGPNRNTAVTATGAIIGTPPYFAPEQLQGQKATEQTDIFSYGDMYYELLTGTIVKRAVAYGLAHRVRPPVHVIGIDKLNPLRRFF
jgi:serine/threonine protein kinase